MVEMIQKEALNSEIKPSNEIDQQLEEIIKKNIAKIRVVGCGGAGGNSITRMRNTGITGCEIIDLNTDAQDLLYTNADLKILIGRELTHGLGAGSNPKVGEQAAKESEEEIKQKLGDAKLIFITCGLGGGTGTGAAPVVAEVAR
ncbi:MAG: cell division protein FtsZ, partial [Candidatus Pacearchaeota archaeon]